MGKGQRRSRSSPPRGAKAPPAGAGDLAALRETVREQARQIAELEAALERAQRDALTGLATHGRFWEVLRGELARAKRHERALSLVMLDVDHLKVRNDREGHLAGDRALAGVAARIRERCRASDFAARYGGDEFAIVLPETPLAGALAFAGELEQRIAATLPLRASFGVAAFPLHGSTAKALVAAADRALYRAKAEGRGRVVAANGADSENPAAKDPEAGTGARSP